MQAPERIAELLFKRLQAGLTPAEAQELENWVASSPANQALFDELTDPDQITHIVKDFYHDKETVWNKMLKQAPELDEQAGIKIQIWKPLVAAAAVLVILGAIYFHNRAMPSDHTMGDDKVVAFADDIKPGCDKAMLTLSNGMTIALDSAAKGSLADQGSMKLLKSDSGQIAYHPINKKNAADDSGYNTLTTPRGGQYRLLLPDGTKVWLNAASSLRYRPAFNNRERSIELLGEAYFEVAHDAARPFKVILANATEITVMGTHFNITNYPDDDNMAATLMEGSIRIKHEAEVKIIIPGQQATISNHSPEILIIPQADTAQVIAWKNGMTIFRNAGVPAIMRILSRWYDVDIQYEGNISPKIFSGGIPRHAKLSQLLKILTLGDIHCKLVGRKIVVTE